MLNRLASLNGYKLTAIDGDLGEVGRFYFDAEHWMVRYLVANVRTWLIEKQYLISPYGIGDVLHHRRTIMLDLTKKQILKGPPLKTNVALSRSFEDYYHSYYGLPKYWEITQNSRPCEHCRREERNNPGLPSAHSIGQSKLHNIFEIYGHVIRALDGEVGELEDFIVDDRTWTISYLVVRTKTWLPGKSVLVSPQWIGKVNWEESSIHLNLTLETIRQSPECTTEALLYRDDNWEQNRQFEPKLYWVQEASA